ncbi:hypothetical protein B0H10DRAFT_2233676 [Mycena sp. CBHHK59/15]|nr:hypothetical protein B0H10DRAFT_2233676 [Mycena sp. CBHHK59/15]
MLVDHRRPSPFSLIISPFCSCSHSLSLPEPRDGVNTLGPAFEWTAPLATPLPYLLPLVRWEDHLRPNARNVSLTPDTTRTSAPRLHFPSTFALPTAADRLDADAHLRPACHRVSRGYRQGPPDGNKSAAFRNAEVKIYDDNQCSSSANSSCQGGYPINPSVKYQ